MIAWKPRFYDSRVAGTRIRTLLTIEALQARGHEVELFTPAHLARYKTIVFSKSYSASDLKLAQRAASHGCRIVVDLFDNHFYNPYKRPELDRARSDLLAMLGCADVIVASTTEMARMIQSETGVTDDIRVIPDPIESEIAFTGPMSRLRSHFRRALLCRGFSRNNGTRLIWFGIHGGRGADHGMSDLMRLADTLNRISQIHSIQLTILSDSWQHGRGVSHACDFPCHYLSWRQEDFLPILKLHEIALIPVTLNPFTICKSATRPAQALDAGLAVVADPVPSYKVLSDAIELGNWHENICRLIEDPDYRRRRIDTGQALARSMFSRENICTLWEMIIDTPPEEM